MTGRPHNNKTDSRTKWELLAMDERGMSDQIHSCQRSASSKSSEVIRGVPQGSVIGPILFLLFVDDVPNCITGANARIRLFTDDTSLTVKDPNRLDLMNLASEKTHKISQSFQHN
ncbi:hypothetical protein J6590_042750 [Homalodisca vitripennis]|nr:hypothetical protein J6590_042750 [Homalodisca vitripennis]